LLMARILSTQDQSFTADSSLPPSLDPLFVLAKADVRRTLEILDIVGSGAPEMQKTRTDVLRCAFEEIPW
ncbi:hypothetical protein AOQ84DRAFT_230832, partial [Glonium stellatum]